MRSLIHYFSFYYTKFYVFTYVFIKNIFFNKWENVKGIYLPLEFSLGFDTLRWIVNHQYEINEISIIEKTIKTEDVILEIGTGLGFVSAFCSKVINNKIYTFEANPNNFEISKKVFKKNNVNPHIENIILGSTNGNVHFSINNKNILASSLISTTKNTIKIATRDLNITINSIKPTYLVMDIEGGEYDIFKIINFQTIRKLQFELHPKLLNEEKCNEIFEILKTNQFNIDNNISKNNNYYFSKSQ